MPARRLDGASVAAQIRSELVPDIASFTDKAGRLPSLAVVPVGDVPATHAYVRRKERAGGEAGIAVAVHRLPPTTEMGHLLWLIQSLNADAGTDGILVQSPLPAGVGKAQRAFDAIDPRKDV